MSVCVGKDIYFLYLHKHIISKYQEHINAQIQGDLFHPLADPVFSIDVKIKACRNKWNILTWIMDDIPRKGTCPLQSNSVIFCCMGHAYAFAAEGKKLNV